MTSLTLGFAHKSFQADMTRSLFQDPSYERYNRMIERFIEFHGGRTTLLEGVATPQAIRDFLDGTFTRDHATSTITLAQTILSSWFSHLVMDEHIATNPMDKVKRPKVPRDRIVCRLTPEEVTAMIDGCVTWPEAMCIASLAYTGSRRTELAKLRWSDVDGKAWTATYVGKGGKLIAKPIPNELRKVWTQYWIEQGPFDLDEWVIPNRTVLGRTDQRSPRIVYQLVCDVRKRVGIHATCHAFRRAYASQFLRQNPGQIETLAYLMCHSSIATTQRYLDDIKKEDAMQKVINLDFAPRAAADTERRAA